MRNYADDMHELVKDIKAFAKDKNLTIDEALALIKSELSGGK